MSTDEVFNSRPSHANAGKVELTISGYLIGIRVVPLLLFVSATGFIVANSIVGARGEVPRFLPVATGSFGSDAALHDRQKTARSSRSDVSTKLGAIQVSAGGESGHLRYKRYVPMTIQTRRLQLW
jgi:hypothetical protein